MSWFQLPMHASFFTSTLFLSPFLSHLSTIHMVHTFNKQVIIFLSFFCIKQHFSLENFRHRNRSWHVRHAVDAIYTLVVTGCAYFALVSVLSTLFLCQPKRFCAWRYATQGTVADVGKFFLPFADSCNECWYFTIPHICSLFFTILLFVIFWWRALLAFCLRKNHMRFVARRVWTCFLCTFHFVASRSSQHNNSHH